ncbi:MAG TPA: NYN domain-containing protein [Candidatus Thermoplasmatota archaeon]|nr:NYN domain-containing protein [Candidatus Thermoplasmatota archaeon]
MPRELPSGAPEPWSRPHARSDASVAILIDYENARDVSLQRVLAEAAAFGRVIVRRAYADWTRHAKAQNALREAGFEELHQFTSGSGTKNATDIHLTVDAMDILYTRPVDVFMLVTADSDFAKLARRLREGGKRVIGMGSKKRVGRALVQSCDQFIYYDQAPAPASPAAPMPETAYAEEARAAAAEPKPRGGKGGGAITEKHRIVLEAMPAAMDDEGRVYGGPLHESIRRIRPDFSYRDFGFSSFSRFIESLAPVIRTRRDPEASDFAVWVDPAHERDLPRADNLPTQEPDVGVALDRTVQEHIHNEWEDLLGDRKRLAGSRAAEVVAGEYGVERLADTPLKDLQGVLDAAPLLAKRWRRERAALVPIERE